MFQYLSDTQMALRPGIIDLGLGHPDPSLLPTAAVQQACINLLARFGSESLNYGWATGPGPLIDWLRARVGQHEGHMPSFDEIFVTASTSHALDQILSLHTQPGDGVLVESPTYHLAVRILKDHLVHLVPAPCDAEGPELNALEHAIQNCRAAGQPIRLMYCVPTFNNPTGRSWSLPRRQAVLALAQRFGFVIVEDDVYRELSYDGPAPPSLWSMAPDNVARLGSFSKSLAPGLRVGWLTAPAGFIQKIARCGLLDSGGGINQFAASLVGALCHNGDFDRQVQIFRAAYRQRRDALLHALAQHLPAACTWHAPAGGFFVWVFLGDGVAASAVLAQAEKLGMAFVPGTKSHLHGGGEAYARLAFSLYAPSQLAEAAQRLGTALTQSQSARPARATVS
jgi:DNA-binding transcriptional MocR family regulator